MALVVVQTENLVVEFPPIRAVDELSLSVNDGEIFGLVGPDGAGKTTTVRVLATIVKPTSGQAFVLGQDIVSRPEAVRGNIGYMAQEFNLYSDLSVLENLRFFADLYRISAEQRAREIPRLLEFAGLEEFTNRRAEYLSGGMKKKLALACTLVHEPKILFLDEPTTGVDPVSRREFWSILSDLHRQGTTLFITTPYMDEAERCSRVAFMDKGQVVLTQTPRAIKESIDAETLEIAARPVLVAREVAEEVPGVLDTEVFGNRFRVTVKRDRVDALLSELRKRVDVTAVRRRAPSMEGVFATVLGKSNRE